MRSWPAGRVIDLLLKRGIRDVIRCTASRERQGKTQGRSPAAATGAASSLLSSLARLSTLHSQLFSTASPQFVLSTHNTHSTSASVANTATSSFL